MDTLLASFALDKIGIVVIVGEIGRVGQKPAIIALLLSDALVFLLGKRAFGHVVGDFCLGCLKGARILDKFFYVFYTTVFTLYLKI